MSLRIGIDVDGVLADFRAAFHKAALACGLRNLPDPEEPKSAQSLAQKDVKRVWEYVGKTRRTSRIRLRGYTAWRERRSGKCSS